MAALRNVNEVGYALTKAIQGCQLRMGSLDRSESLH